jgi:hypothetical protein
MTRVYYDALFSGELGFELLETFQGTFELGFLARIRSTFTHDVCACVDERI